MSLKLAALALLDVEPGSGYGLLQRFRNSIGFFWQTSHQQLYKELHGLLEEGLVDCTDVPQDGRPDKKVYHLNANGTASLRAMLGEPAGPTKVKDPLLLKLFAGGLLPREDVLAELHAHRSAHEATLATYRQLQDQIAALPSGLRTRYRFPAHTLRFGVRYEESWLAWCDEVIADLQDTP